MSINNNLSKLFDIGEVFIDKFLTNYYYEKGVFSLKSSLGLFVILLRYLEPEWIKYEQQRLAEQEEKKRLKLERKRAKRV